MEMCYDGALVMPKSYALMNEDEMTYVEGGWDGEVFVNNLKGAYNGFREAKLALLAGGLTLGAIAKTAASSAEAIYLAYGTTISATATAIGGIVVGVIVTVGLLAGITYLGNHRVWY